MNIPSAILGLTLLIAIFSCNTTKTENMEDAKEQMDLIVTEIAANQSYRVGELIELSMMVTNTGSKKYTFLPWGTPIENRFTGDCLQIKYDNQVLDYNGIMVKRMAPTNKDYITLEYNQSVSGKINVLDGYSLDKRGVYTIQFREDRGLPASNMIEIEIR